MYMYLYIYKIYKVYKPRLDIHKTDNLWEVIYTHYCKYLLRGI